MKIAIAAAAGNIGSQTAHQVADQGATPVLMGPRVEKLKALSIPGAIIRQTDISDLDQVIEAT